jgi:uncharacterized protein
VEPWGLAGDRRWLVVEPDGKFITQRAEPRLALIRPLPIRQQSALLPDGQQGLVLATEGLPDLEVPAPTGDERMRVRVWKDTVDAVPAGEAADDWLSDALDRKVRLVHLRDPGQRPAGQDYARPGDLVSFADAYPVLVTNAASLDAVNDWLVEGGDEPVPMSRFRPNLVVTDAPAWAEDEWLGRRIRVGAVTLRAVKPCDRCVVTTIDQDTAERQRQPLRVLGKHRRFPQGLLFGVNLVPDEVGPVAVGDPVEIEIPA